MTGRSVEKKWQFVLVGERLFRRVDATWLEYPPAAEMTGH